MNERAWSTLQQLLGPKRYCVTATVCKRWAACYENEQGDSLTFCSHMVQSTALLRQFTEMLAAAKKSAAAIYLYVGIAVIQYAPAPVLQHFIESRATPRPKVVRSFVDLATRVGNVAALDTFRKSHWPVKRKSLSISRSAAWRGHLNVLKWCAQQNYRLHKDLHVLAVSGGCVQMVQWLYEQNFQFDEFTVWLAAARGSLDIMQCLIQQMNIPWDVQDCAAKAASYGHLHILEWMLEERYALDLNTLATHASTAGHLHILE